MFHPRIMEKPTAILVTTEEEFYALTDWISANTETPHNTRSTDGLDVRLYLNYYITPNTNFGCSWEFCSYEYYSARGYNMLTYKQALHSNLRRK